MYLLGYDIGSSSVKAALINTATGQMVSKAQHPKVEMEMLAQQPDWAEQAPEDWWESVCVVTKKILADTKVNPLEIKGIGISYQMHGLVLVDKNQEVLRPSIIWCDSRAVEIGNKAFQNIGEEKCLEHFLNSPGNFTASKLKWVQENEPEIYAKIDKFFLPGDYIAMKLTGEVTTTISGLSEGILWDFKENKPASLLLEHYGISENLLPDLVDTFQIQGKVTAEAVAATGLAIGTPIGYRAGDQPNNALSLGAINPGEVAATGGTSGVIYGVIDQPVFDRQSRINPFGHVNHEPNQTRLGLLLCINGAGSQYAWVKKQIAETGRTYVEMEKMLETIPIGADGLRIIPFGNGAERVLGNQSVGSHIINLQFNRHQKAHIYRAALEGIAFSFVYGFEILKELGLNPKAIKVGNDNLFQSPVFAKTIANLIGCEIEMIATTGAVGAAKGSGFGVGIYHDLKEAIKSNEVIERYLPDADKHFYKTAYEIWKRDLEEILVKSDLESK